MSKMSDQVNLWLFKLDELEVGYTEAAYSELTPSEQALVNKFVFEIDRSRAVWSKFLRRKILAISLDSPEESIQFSLTYFGKPSISWPISKLQFNISHTRTALIIGISTTNPLGIDIEEVSSVMDIDDIAKQYYADSEVAYLSKYIGQEKLTRFFYFWTLKEAYLKGCGAGLSRNPKECEFVLPSEPQGKTISIQKRPMGLPYATSLLFTYDKTCVGSVCTVNRDIHKSQVNSKRLTPKFVDGVLQFTSHPFNIWAE